MSFNIVQDAKTFFNHEVVNKASKMLGESEAGIIKSIDAAVPAVFMFFTDSISNQESAVQIAKTIQKNPNLFPDSPYAMTEHNIIDNLGKDSEITKSLLGDKANLISDSVSQFSGVKSSTVNSLLSIVVSVVLGLLKKHTSGSGISAQSITAILSNQKDHIMNSLPHHMNIDGLTSVAGMAGGATTGGALPPTQGAKNKPAGWLIPVIIIALILLGIWFFMRKNNDAKKDIPDTETSFIIINNGFII